MQTKKTIVILLTIILTVIAQVWIISAGRMRNWPVYTSYYNRLSQAFLFGQTHLLVQPRPELLALSDPYDPVANAPYRFHDASLYNGKYYFYWGPVPALFLALIKTIHPAEIGDVYLVFWFIFGTVVFSVLFMMTIQLRYFGDRPWWTILPGILAAGLSYPVTFFLARSAIYEAAIISGQFFLIAGMYCAFVAFDKQGGIISWRLCLAGACLALSVGCRLSLATAVVPLSLLIASYIYFLSPERNRLSKASFFSLAALFFPLITGAVLLGLYNYVRFGSFVNAGISYQLTGLFNIHAILIQKPVLFQSKVVLASLYSYLFRPPVFQFIFPYVTALSGYKSPAIPTMLAQNLPAMYYSDNTTGLVVGFPFTLFIFIPIAYLIKQLYRGILTRFQEVNKNEANYFIRSSFNFLVLMLVISLLGTFFVLITFTGGVSMRYLMDIIPSLIILTMVGFWQSWRFIVARKWAWLVVSLSLLVPLILGMPYGLTGYYGHFARFNPVLYKRLPDGSQDLANSLYIKVMKYFDPPVISKRLAITFNPVAGVAEPLIVSGIPGAGDFIYVKYLSRKKMVFGYNHWGTPQKETQPIRIHPGQSQTLEFILDNKNQLITVISDGKFLFGHPLSIYYTTPEQVTIGENNIGGTATTEIFTGVIKTISP